MATRRSLPEYNPPGGIHGSLFPLLDETIYSIETMSLDKDEFLSVNEPDYEDQKNSSNKRNFNGLNDQTFLNLTPATFHVESEQTEPIQFKMLEEIKNRRRCQTVPKLNPVRPVSKEFKVSEIKEILKLKEEYEKKSDRNVSNLESFRKQGMIVQRYSDYNQEIVKFTRIFEEFSKLISNFPNNLQQAELFKNACRCKTLVEKQLKCFENKSYNQLTQLDNAFVQLSKEMDTLDNIQTHLENAILHFKEEMFQRMQQQQILEHQQQILESRHQQLLQQQSLQNTAPIISAKRTPSISENFFNLSSLKASSSKPTQQPQLPPTELIKFLEDMESKCSVWEKSWPKTKILTFKRLANTTVNAISSQDMSSLLDKINKLDTLLNGETLTALDQTVRLETQDEIDYCSNLITGKLIKKGEQEVSSNPKAAHPVSSVIVCLCSNHQTLAKLLLGSFYRSCPIMAPIFPKQGMRPNSEDFLLSIGYKVKDNKLEDPDEFSNRIKGLLRLYTCVMQFPIEGIGSVHSISSHFHGINQAWTWMVKVLQGPMVHGVSEVALHAAFELMGNRMSRVYGNQFSKLVQITRNDFLPNLRQVSPPEHNPSIARLQKFLDDHKTVIPESDGAFSNGFWTKNVFRI